MKIRGLLSLISIQSVPLTLVSLGLGYSTITGTVLTLDILPLMVAGVLGHWTFYSLNDLYDMEWDVNEGRENKPLVKGSVTRTEGLHVFVLLLVLTVAVSLTFPYEALFFWVVAILMGFKYNRDSKEDIHAGVYLGVWGASIILTGAIYAGGVNGLSVILALLLGVHMFWMTVMGNLKDVGHGEVSIPERLDCKIIDEQGYKILWTSGRFNIASVAIILVHIVLLLLLPVGDGAQSSDPLYIYIAIVGAVAIWEMFKEVLYQPGFNRDSMKKDIAKFEVVSASFVIVVSVSFMSIETAMVMVLGTILWGLTWQTVLYGHPLRFP